MLLLPARPQRLDFRVAYAIVIVMGLLLSWRMVYGNRSGWGVDFNQFYAASHLAGTGKLYDWDALQKEELKNGLTVHTARLPVVAYGVKAISWLPYNVAHWVWVIGSAGALVLMVLLWPSANKAVMFAVLAWSGPAALLLLLGQDTPFWLLSFAAGFALLKRGRTAAAGVVLALCLCKFHLAAGIPIILLARHQWRAILWGAASTALLLGTCFLIEGLQWPARYMEVFRAPLLSPASERMPNLRGLAYWTPWPMWTQAALVTGFVVLLWMAGRRTEEWGVLAALGAAFGLVLAPHGYGNDLALLIPLIALCLVDKKRPQWLRISALVVMSPIPLLMLVSDKPASGQLLICGFVAVSAIWAK